MTGFSSKGLVFSITTLRYPTVEPIRVARLVQFTDGEVEIELNELRTARVTISIYDEACKEVLPLERMLHVRYLGRPVFWGMILEPEWDFTAGAVHISAIDAGYRMEKHYVRIGDQVETDGFVTVDGAGVRLLRDCALNIPDQTARGVPDLGVGDGVDTVPSSSPPKVKVTRGDGVWSTIQDITESIDNPMDVDLEPQEIDQGSYVLLNTSPKQGEDRSDSLIFHYGWGTRNLSAFSAAPSGSAVVTHDHVLSENLQHRGTASAPDPSARFGVYVKWDALDRDVDPDDPDPDATLAAFGKGTVRAYGEPPRFLKMTPSVDPGVGPVATYGVDFVVGDTCKVVAKKGYGYFNEVARIRKATIKQANTTRALVQTEIEAVPSILESGDVGGDEQ